MHDIFTNNPSIRNTKYQIKNQKLDSNIIVEAEKGRTLNCMRQNDELNKTKLIKTML